jgi:hypothetical protein
MERRFGWLWEQSADEIFGEKENEIGSSLKGGIA